ncbi:MAG TPA: ATP-binding protein [Nannocystis exedens]|nr:ATP-binding protein [Nannocystis exedens]
MLLRFSIENHRSFRGPSELSLVSTSRKDAPTWRHPSRHAKHGVLPTLGLWGANGSGKSNILGALLEFQTLVRDSFIKIGPNEPLPWSPWRHRRGPEDPPTRMDIDLLMEADIRIHYGFKFTSKGFVEEWMYRWVGSRRQILYERSLLEDNDDPWYFGSSLTGARSQIARATRNNSLFLSTAAQHNHPILLPIFSAIVDKIVPEHGISLHGYPLFRADNPLLADSFRPALTKLLQAADLGVADLKIRPHRHQPVNLPGEAEAIFKPEFLAELKAHKIQSEPENTPLQEIHLRHGTAEDSWDLPPQDESRGTHILLARLADFLPVLRSGNTLVVDELDTSLHPDLCALLVGLFTDQRSNPHGAQLIFSTHDRGLLRHLRTDEVVLVDKERDGESQLVPSSDYRGLRTRDDLRRAHEEGQLGGVPVLGDLIGLFAAGLIGGLIGFSAASAQSALHEKK